MKATLYRNIYRVSRLNHLNQCCLIQLALILYMDQLQNEKIVTQKKICMIAKPANIKLLLISPKELKIKTTPLHLMRPPNQIKENLIKRKNRKERPKSGIPKAKPSSKSLCQNSKIKNEEQNWIVKYNQGKISLEFFFKKLRTILDSSNINNNENFSPQSPKKKKSTNLNIFQYLNKDSNMQDIYFELMNITKETMKRKISFAEYSKFLKLVVPIITNKQIDDSFYYIQKLYSKIKEDKEKENTPGSKKKNLDDSSLSTERNKYILIADLNSLYENFVRVKERLNNTLSMYNLKLKKEEFKRLIRYWEEICEKEKMSPNIIKCKEKEIILLFNKFKDTYHINIQLLEEAIQNFSDILKSKEDDFIHMKRIFKFCSHINENPEEISMNNIFKMIDLKRAKNMKEYEEIKNIVAEIKDKCILEKNFFSFYDIPDLLVNKNLQSDEYKFCILFLKKLKNRYINLRKKEVNAQENADELTLDDLIPIVLLEEVSVRMKFSSESKLNEIDNFFQLIKEETTHKLGKLEVSNESTITKITNNIFITFLINHLENLIIIFKLFEYKIRKLHLQFTSKSFSNISEISDSFQEIIAINKENYNFRQFIQNFDKYIHSTITNENRTTSLSLSNTHDLESQNQQVNTFEEKQNDKENKGKTGLLLSQRKDNAKLNTADTFYPVSPLTSNNLNKLGQDVLEEMEVEEKKAEFERKKREKNEKYFNLFQSRNGERYDPLKKFGTLIDDYLIYEGKSTTTYPMLRPIEESHKSIMGSSPSSKKKWFLRGHHCETLTQHEKSIPDDVLNTSYYSFYESFPHPDQNPELTLTMHTLDSVRNQLNEIKETRLKYDKSKISREENADFDKANIIDINKMDYNSKVEEIRKIENEIASQRLDKTTLVADTCESIMYVLRKKEKDILNLKRKIEFSKSRPPIKGWYALKSPQFIGEYKRNSMFINSKEDPYKYLNLLKDNKLY